MEKVLGGLKWTIRVVAAAGVAVGGGIWLVFSKNLPPQIPLWYSRPWGEDQLAIPGWLGVIPFLILAVGIGVELGTKLIRDKVLNIMLFAAGIVGQVILMLGLLRIVWLVG